MIRVIKIGGRAQSHPALADAIAGAWRSDPALVVVHGGGDEVTQLQRALGHEPRFVNGRRATSPEELEAVRMVLSGSVNKRLVGQFLAAGVPAAGISGEDAGLLTCRPFGDGSLGAVGEPEHTDTTVIRALVDSKLMPVVSPLGRFANGAGCNVNGDDAAAAIAAGAGADELLLVADVQGVLDDTGKTVQQLDGSEAALLISNGVATGGMIAKLEAAVRALGMGVARVRIGDLDAIRNPDAGTTIAAFPSAAVAR